MPRDKQNLETRFSAEMTLWRQALTNGGGRFTLPDNGKAVNAVFRLNIIRRKIRERDGETDLDLYSVNLKKGDNVVIVQPRPMIDATFSPLVYDDLNLDVEEELKA